MQMNELMGTIETLNAKVGNLNSQRLTDLGKKETLEKQLATAVADYKSTYGVELTKDNIDSECSKVETDLIQRSNKLSKLISLIESGNYTEADKLASSVEGVTSTDITDEPRDIASTTSANDVAEAPNVSTPSADTTEPRDIASTTYTGVAVETPNVSTPSAEASQVREPVPVSPNVGSNVGVTPSIAQPNDPIPSVPASPNVGVASSVAQPNDPVPSAPTPPIEVNHTPNTGAAPAQLSFSDILNGSDFK